MRVNLPVFTEEYKLDPRQSLVSTTDLKGRILHCNPAFVIASGFESQELMGQPHNLVRHPDMPPEAFRDMWTTISSGKPWTGLVKNRRKDGRYYWVMANVTPLMDGDRPVGYLSVRTVPSRDAVARAEQLYQVMREEQAAGQLVHTLHNGHVQQITAFGRLRRALQLGEMGRAALATGALGAATALTGAGIAASTGLSWGSAALAFLMGALLGTGLGGFMAYRREAQVRQLTSIANRMAGCDLTQELNADRQDHLPASLGALRRALSQLNVNVRSVVSDALDEVESLRNAAQEIAKGNQDLATRTESQAANLQETAASLEEITGAVRQSSDAAAQAAQLAGQAHQVTAASGQAMEAVTQTMHSIDGASRRIGEIIGVIDGIAFQTNILALNAAVEAARAGEQGRGFAVVAAEVRSLAQRTTQAAKEIKVLIGDSADKVRVGNEQTDAAQATMSGALTRAQETSTLIESISMGSREQLTGISQVHEAVAQLDTITQQNAALVEELAAAAMRVEQQAGAVAHAVQVFALPNRQRETQDAVALRRAARAEATAE